MTKNPHPVAQEIAREVERLRYLDWADLRGKNIDTNARLAAVDELEPPTAFLIQLHSSQVLDRLTPGQLAVLRGAVSVLDDAIRLVEEHNRGAVVDPRRGHEIRDRDSTAVSKSALELEKALLPFNALFINAVEFRALSDESTRVLDEIKRHSAALPDLATAISKLKTEATDALAAAREAAGERSATASSKIFMTAGGTHRIVAFVWLGVAVLLAAAILTIAGCAAFGHMGAPPYPDKEWHLAGNLAYFGARVLFVSILSFLVVISIRNHKAAMHNHEVNAHRGRALDAYHGFVSAAGGERARDLLVAQAAHVAFSAQATGYSGADPPGATHFGELLAADRGEKEK